MKTRILAITLAATAFFALPAMAQLEKEKAEQLRDANKVRTVQKVDLRNIKLTDRTVASKLESGGLAADTIKQLVTEIVDKASIEKVKSILKDADPNSYAAQFVTVKDGKVVEQETMGKMPLTSLKQLSRQASFKGGAEADTIKQLVTEIVDKTALERLQTTLQQADTERIFVKPLSMQ